MAVVNDDLWRRVILRAILRVGGAGIGVADTPEAVAGSLSALGKILAIWLCKKKTACRHF